MSTLPPSAETPAPMAFLEQTLPPSSALRASQP
jgi:hypothetical protein